MSRLTGWWHGFNAHEKRSILGMAGFVALLHVVGWGVLAFVVEPQNLQITSDGHKQLFGIGLGLTAYTLGMRHAFDADHIAAIDNTTRKLLADREGRIAAGERNPRRPLSVGFWFSLGHSTVVFGLAALLAEPVADPFAQEVVAVPARGVERWLAQRLFHIRLETLL